jgi:predicted RNA-binding Zn-ribbon protein involved in translation (DUF1610 family)
MRTVLFLLAIVLGLVGFGVLSGSPLLGTILLGFAFSILIAGLRRKSKQNVGFSVFSEGSLSPSERMARISKLKFTPVGNLEAMCPYCNQSLEKKPVRKKKCPHCGQFIYVRTRPSDEHQVIVTEAQAEEIAEQWSIVNGTHDAYLAEKKRFTEEKDKLAKRFGREPSDNDVRWSQLNQELIEHARQRNWGFFRNAKFEMAEILRKEGRSAGALGFYLEVCYLDLNGPNNTSGITDSELLRQYPPWNPKDLTANLAPGILDRVARIIQKNNQSPATVEEIYRTRASVLHTSLRLPLSPASVWPKIRKALFHEEA